MLIESAGDETGDRAEVSLLTPATGACTGRVQV